MNKKEIKIETKNFAFNNKANIWLIVFLVGIANTIISNVINKIFNITNIESLTDVNLLNYSVANILTSFISIALVFISTAYLINYYRTKESNITKAFKFAVDHYKTIIIASILYSLNFSIGCMLFIVPGIIAALGLSMMPQILYDNPNLSGTDLLRKTWEFTNGYKSDYFVYLLSYIGWILLCIFVVPIIWVLPLMQMAGIVFYEKLKEIKK